MIDQFNTDLFSHLIKYLPIYSQIKLAQTNQYLRETILSLQKNRCNNCRNNNMFCCLCYCGVDYCANHICWNNCYILIPFQFNTTNFKIPLCDNCLYCQRCKRPYYISSMNHKNTGVYEITKCCNHCNVTIFPHIYARKIE